MKPRDIDRSAVARSFGAAAERYDITAQMQAEILAERVAALNMEIAGLNDPLLLDMGCGTGRLAALVQESKLDWRIIGSDLSFGMCKVARERCSVVTAPAERLPFANGTFDALLSSLVLQWVARLPETFAESRRVIKQGGVAVFALFGTSSLKELREAFEAVDEFPHVMEFPSLELVRAAAQQGGFEILAAEREMRMEWYSTARQLGRELKGIGAANRHAARSRGMMSPRQWRQMEAEYTELFERNGMLPATWEVLTLTLKAQ